MVTSRDDPSRLLVSSQDGGAIVAVDTTTGEMSVEREVSVRVTKDSPTSGHLRGLAVDSNGCEHVADKHSDAVWHYCPDNVVTMTQISKPIDLFVDGALLYVGSFDNKKPAVYVLDLQSTPGKHGKKNVRTFTHPSLLHPAGMLVHSHLGVKSLPDRWSKVGSTLLRDSAPSAHLLPPGARPAPTHPQLASGRPKIEDSPLLDHQVRAGADDARPAQVRRQLDQLCEQHPLRPARCAREGPPRQRVLGRLLSWRHPDVPGEACRSMSISWSSLALALHQTARGAPAVQYRFSPAGRVGAVFPVKEQKSNTGDTRVTNSTMT